MVDVRYAHKHNFLLWFSLSNCIRIESSANIQLAGMAQRQPLTFWEKLKQDPKKTRKEIGAETLAICMRKFYFKNGVAINISVDDVQNSTKLSGIKWITGKNKTTVRLCPLDTLDTAVLLTQKRENPSICILNFANDERPGGYWGSGSHTQEDDLFYRTDLSTILPSRSDLYPIKEFEVIYTPKIQIFRGNEKSGYELMETQVPVACISAAAYKFRRPIDYLDEKHAAGTRMKIATVLTAAAENGHDTLILGAFGCGAFGNPPDHIAELFKQTFAEFSGTFKEIVFAIPPGDGNLDAFKKVFAPPKQE